METRLVRSRGFDPEKAPQLTSSRAAAEVAGKLVQSDRERLLALYLNTQNRLIGVQQVSVGARSSALVPPDAVLRAALLANAAGVILVHNHPSGRAEPSPEDKEMFRRLRDAGRLMDINVLDALVVADGRHTSLADLGV